MTFPRLNMASYWLYFLGGVVMVISFFSRAAQHKAVGQATPHSPQSSRLKDKHGGCLAWFC